MNSEKSDNVDRRTFLGKTAKLGVGAAATVALPSIAQGQQRPKKKEAPPASADYLQDLRREYPELASAWARVPTALKQKPWTVDAEKDIASSPEVRTFFTELGKVFEGIKLTDELGGLTLTDVAFGQIAGREGYMVSKRSRDLLSSVLRAGIEAGLAIDHEKSEDQAGLNELFGTAIRAGQQGIKQLAKAYAEFMVGLERGRVVRAFDLFVDSDPSSRLVVPLPEARGKERKDLTNADLRVLTSDEVLKYAQTGKPREAFVQELLGDNEWHTAELVPSDLTWDFATSDVSPYSFRPTPLSAGEKVRAPFSSPHALTIGYLQSLLHVDAVNMPGSQGRGWHVTGNVTEQFLAHLPRAFALISPNDESIAVALAAREQHIIEDKILGQVEDVRLESTAQTIEELFKPLEGNPFAITTKTQIPSDFVVRAILYEGTGSWTDPGNLFEMLYDKDTKAVKAALWTTVIAGHKNRTSWIRSGGRLNAAGTFITQLNVEIPDPLKLLMQRSIDACTAYERALKALREMLADRPAVERRITEGSTASIPITELNVPGTDGIRISAPKLMVTTVSDNRGLWRRLTADDTDPSTQVSVDRDSIAIANGMPPGRYRIEATFGYELPQKPTGYEVYEHTAYVLGRRQYAQKGEIRRWITVTVDERK